MCVFEEDCRGLAWGGLLTLIPQHRVILTVSAQCWRNVFEHLSNMGRCVHKTAPEPTVPPCRLPWALGWRFLFLYYFCPCSPALVGEGNDNPLQYSCLGNPMDRGAWQATVHGVAKESDMTEHLNPHLQQLWHPSSLMLLELPWLYLTTSGVLPDL